MAMKVLALVLVSLGWVSQARAVDEVFATEDGAVRGYDVVAYHEQQKAVKGSAEFSHDWQGATWRFASAASRDKFSAAPEKYAPKYGGYCAYGMSQGYKVGTDPEAFAIVDGALYLNYNKSVQRTWNQDRPGYIKLADGNWLKLEHSAYE
jgi:YHS domain-containing protein